MANISKIKLPSGVTYDVVDNTSGYITGYTETDPVFSSSAAAGITSTDISNWGYAYNGYNSLQWNDIKKALRASKQGTAVTLFEQSDMAYDSTSNTNGFLTISDIPSWAKASTKPTYTASEVGALPDTTTIPTITLNGTSTTSASFYAPTTAGTSGYYLESNGSGAPTWIEPPDLSEYVEWIALSSSSVPTTFTNDTISFNWDATTYSSPNQNVQWALERIIYEIDEVGNAKADSNTLASIAISGSYNDLLNANWLNGSAIGSVRTSGSTVEDSNYTIGNYAVAEGQSTKASGNYSHAEGHGTTASAADSHAEGLNTVASAITAHAEGDGTTASALAAHAEGYSTTASGKHSHASGRYTTAQTVSQTVIGEYNILDTAGTTSTRGNYAFIIGNGTSENARSNALAIKWDGTVETAKGNLSGVQIVRW